jgi:hypothetical protein
MLRGSAPDRTLQRRIMSEQPQLPGELLYEYTLKITQVVEYGVSMEALLSGQAPPPGEGVRLDIHLEGAISGAKLNGSVTGVDYLHVRGRWPHAARHSW